MQGQTKSSSLGLAATVLGACVLGFRPSHESAIGSAAVAARVELSERATRAGQPSSPDVGGSG